MHARHSLARADARRRGVVLVLILAMLGLLALIGVSFATLAGQAQSGSRKVVEGMNAPLSDNVMDFALTQLINDTANPMSALRGHSLKRDMYGPDGKLNGFLAALPNGTALTITTVNGTGPYTYTTNIPVGLPYNFTNWSLKLLSGNVTQTFEVLVDNTSGATHTFTLTVPATTQVFNPATSTSIPLSQPAAGLTFILDGRYRRAFNGPGMAGYAQYANFRLNGTLVPPFTGPYAAAPNLGDPDVLGMDEDYDAADLDNWFLALQSADGAVVIPSFHRPGILSRADWAAGAGLASRAKILRPRAADHPAFGASFPDPIPPVPTPGTPNSVTFDVDNDGDGIKDAVWLDAGFPAQRDANGKLYKPLFAYTVTGLNGKLPLNTAGNIQGRHQEDYVDPVTGQTYNAGDPTLDHVSHVGTSPHEINPKYALQNAPDTSGTVFSQFDDAATPGTPGPGGVNVALTQLRNILTGTVPMPDPTSPPTSSTNNGQNRDGNIVRLDNKPYQLPNNIYDRADTSPDGGKTVPRLSQAVAGRWGEVTYIPNLLYNPNPPSGRILPDFMAFNSPVRAGRSINFLAPTNPTNQAAPFPLWDSADDQFRGLDFYPPLTTNASGVPVTFPEQQDTYDAAGGVQFPSERIRRFVMPIDPSGNGRVLTFATTPSQNLGPDNRGRVAPMFYFRPPGLPPVVKNATGANPVTTPPAVPTPTTVGDVTNNPLHGYEGQINPNYTPVRPTGPHFASMPYVDSNVKAPTFTFTDTSMVTRPYPVNSMPNPYPYPINPASPPGTAPYGPAPGVTNNYYGGSLTTDLADEMNPYVSTVLDSPFGVHDLEWLYRSHDVDGASLHSRLSQLAPISFADKTLAPRDGIMRRNMFSGDTFDLINFVYAHDNPDGATFSNNSRFATGVGASLANLGMPTPQLALGDRKINLNFPLPVSNAYNEPVRLKWITDAYELLLNVLPLRAVDTAVERAALSQYLINIIDFRDPDCTVTTWQSPDLQYIPAVLKGTGMPAATVSSPGRVVKLGDPGYDVANPPAKRLVQYGMEYSPVALTEVLAYTFNRFDTGSSDPAKNTETPRLFIEMVNTLTQSSTNIPPVLPSTTPTYPTDVSLAGWDLVVTPDDVTGRPDPVTGQIPVLPQPIAPATVSYMIFPFGTGTIKPSLPSQSVSGMPVKSTIIQNNPGGTFVQNIDETGTTSTAPPTPPTTMTPATTIQPPSPAPPASSPPQYLFPFPAARPKEFATGAYYWLYLRRPANPFDAPPYTAAPSPNMVVVDAFRFPFTKGSGKGTGPGAVTFDPSPPATKDIYSLERYQPYRGGHNVPTDTALENAGTPPRPIAPSPLNALGFSEQTAPAPPSPPPLPPAVAKPFGGLYNAARTPNQTMPQTTVDIPNSLGTAGVNAENWDHFPFHDRDFMSVAELLLVPGCPPGLFTKQFVENAPDPAVFPPTTSALAPPLAKPKNTVRVTPLDEVGAKNAPDKTDTVGRQLRLSQPHTYPYLVDQFFYTATNNATVQVGGPNGAGWYKMLEFFDVPSSTQGTIGPVAQGQNFDWLRQDRKPGQLNLNLIIDEEVFLGLIDDPDVLNMALANSASTVPQIVIGLDATGNPILQTTPNPTTLSATNASMDRGWFNGNTVAMKACFSDFLKLRHGGSNNLFGFGSGPVGSNLPIERPFHSLSFPDIDFTLLRPATLPPNGTTTPNPSPTPAPPGAPAPIDPGTKNPTLSAPGSGMPPAIPPRRLFEPPDNQDGAIGPPVVAGSNASELGDYRVNTPILHPALANPAADLTAVPVPGPAGPNIRLGGNPKATAVNPDNRQHPYFRTEMLQKLMNLTTTRTHQYAVWITVGFFEVTASGNEQQLVPDTLGAEVGAAAGRNVRYRSFFLVDRTRAIGFNPQDPGDFRDCIVYRSRIE